LRFEGHEIQGRIDDRNPLFWKTERQQVGTRGERVRNVAVHVRCQEAHCHGVPFITTLVGDQRGAKYPRQNESTDIEAVVLMDEPDPAPLGEPIEAQGVRNGDREEVKQGGKSEK